MEELTQAYLDGFLPEYQEVFKEADFYNRHIESKLLKKRYEIRILEEKYRNYNSHYALEYQYKRLEIEKILEEFENKLSEITNRHDEKIQNYNTNDHQDFFGGYLSQKLIVFDANQEWIHIKFERFATKILYNLCRRTFSDFFVK